MPINPLYDPLSEQTMPAQRFLNRNNLEQVPEPADPFVMGLLQRGMAPQEEWSMTPKAQPSASPYIPTGLTDTDIGAVREQRPEQRILGTLGSLPSQSPAGQLPQVEPRRAYEPPQTPGYRGVPGNWDEAPLGEATSKLGNWDQPQISQPQTKTPLTPSEVQLPTSETPQDIETTTDLYSDIPEPQLPEPQPEADRLAQTTLGQRATGMGWDPRRLMAALAQFSGEFGNLRGKPTPSGAPAYLESMLASEQQARENDMKLMEMEKRYAPKPADPLTSLKIEMLQAQRDALQDKTRVNQELNDPNSARSRAAQQSWQRLMQYQSGNKNIQADTRVPAADIFRWIAPTQLGIREVQAPITLQTKQEWESAEKERQRQFLEGENERNRRAAAARAKGAADAAAALEAQRQGGRKELAEAKGGAGQPGEPVVLVPGWQKVQNVPLEKGELLRFKKRVSSVAKIKPKVEKLASLIMKHGAYEMIETPAGTEMARIANDIKLDLKGPEFKALGVLAGPDMNILNALVPDTTDRQNALRSDRAVATSLRNLVIQLEQELDSDGTMIGFERSGDTSQNIGPRGKPMFEPGAK